LVNELVSVSVCVCASNIYTTTVAPLGRIIKPTTTKDRWKIGSDADTTAAAEDKWFPPWWRYFFLFPSIYNILFSLPSRVHSVRLPVRLFILSFTLCTRIRNCGVRSYVPVDLYIEPITTEIQKNKPNRFNVP